MNVSMFTLCHIFFVAHSLVGNFKVLTYYVFVIVIRNVKYILALIFSSNRLLLFSGLAYVSDCHRYALKSYYSVVEIWPKLDVNCYHWKVFID
jgi:hypothetical protein